MSGDVLQARYRQRALLEIDDVSLKEAGIDARHVEVI